MATKGASNLYGSSKNGKHGRPTSHINFAYAKAFNKSTRKDHFDRHGSSMGFVSEQQYEQHAIRFANNIDRKRCVSFVDKKTGATYKYNKVTNELAIIKKDGIIVTYFRPKDGYNYYKKNKKQKEK